MSPSPELQAIGERLRTLDEGRVAVLTVERLLGPVELDALKPEPADVRPRSLVRWAAAAAAILVLVSIWRWPAGSDDQPAVASIPVEPDGATTVPAAVPAPVERTRPIASWSFEHGAAWSVPAGPTLTLGNGVATSTGIEGTALQFSGVWPSAAVTSGPVLDTTGSFTISTVVRPDAIRDCLFQSFVSQDGSVVSGFEVGMTAGCGEDDATFMFVMFEGDADSAFAQRVMTTDPVEAGRWYHVVAVHDVERQELRLYVDGRLEGSLPSVDPWAATGPLAIGRARFSSQDRDFFAGSIDTTAVYDRVLTETEIAAL